MSDQCAICGRTSELVTDHCHKTWFVRGKLCIACNAGLGMFKDSVEMLERAIQYLKAPTSGELYKGSKPKTFGPFAPIGRSKRGSGARTERSKKLVEHREERIRNGGIIIQKRKKLCWELPE